MDPVARSRKLWFAAPAVAAFLVYASTLGAGYLYDDESLIRTNRWVQDGSVLLQLPSKPLLASPPAGTTNYYRPLVVVLYNLTWHSLGGRPVAFHLVNVLIHMLNATLLLQLVRRINASPDVVAVGAATLFAVHPLTSEVVAWPSCLSELGYVGFGLATLLAHVASWSREGSAARRLRVAEGVLFFLACSCKETALVILPLLLLLELWILPLHGSRARPSPAAVLRSVVPHVAAAGLYLGARTAVLGGVVPSGVHRSLSAVDAIWNAPWLLLTYVKAMVFPVPLLIEHVIQRVPSAGDPRFLLGAVVVAAGIVAVSRLRRARPDLALAACIALLPLLPALYLPALGRDWFAERYAYLSIAGFAWLLVGGVEALVRRRGGTLPRWALPSALGVLVVIASARTVARCADWHDDGALGRASMRDEPRAPIGYLLVGSWQKREGRKEEALRAYEDGVAHAPESVELQQNAIGLGIELGRLTQDDAIAAYQRLVPLAAGSPSAQYNLGQALLQRDRLDEAQAAFTRALELAPSSVASMTALAVIASKKGDAVTAAALCRKALVVDERSIPALQQLGLALTRTGDTLGAVAALERAARLDPKDKETLSRLGVAYARAGLLDDARRSWEQALAIDPDFQSARQNLERLRQLRP